MRLLWYAKRRLIRVLLLGCLGIVLVLWIHRERASVCLRMIDCEGKVFCLEMPRSDRDCLEHLFRKLVIGDNFGYTLLGNKPMSAGAYIVPFVSMRPRELYHSLLPDNLRRYWGWKTWEKYEHLFKGSPFALWKEVSPFLDAARVILIVNKEKAKQLLAQQQEDFRKVLQKEQVGLDDLLHELPLLTKSLNNHEALIGMLLGYGRGNAWLFYNRQAGDFYDPLWDEKTSKKEAEKLSYFGKKNMASRLMYPSFIANPDSEETQYLKEEYLATWQTIIDYYQDKDFLEATLSLLYVGHDEHCIVQRFDGS